MPDPPAETPVAGLRAAIEEAERARRARDWEVAARAYRAAIAIAPRRARLHARLGEALRRQRRWPEAAQAFQSAVERNPNRADWLYHLGETRALAEDPAGGTEAIRRALALDPTASELDQRLIALKPWRFRPRRRLVRSVQELLPEIRAAAEASRPEPTSPKIYLYWGQGFATAPPVVQMCLEQVLALNPREDVVLLDDDAARELSEIPDDVWDRTTESKTKLSDVLRCALLSRYGGMWIDATCLVRARLVPLLPRLMRSGYFSFEFGNARVSSWCIASEPGGLIVSMLREAHYAHWRHHETAIDYFLFHHLFEALYLCDEGFRAAWHASHALDTWTPHGLQRVLHDPFDAAMLSQVLASSFVHKLTFKFPEVVPGSMLEHLLTAGPPDPAGEAPWNLPELRAPVVTPADGTPAQGDPAM